MFTFVPVTNTQYQEASIQHDYYSVEFGLNGSHPVYQFKLWNSDQKPPFFLLKGSSALAEQLKVGDIVPMKYYCNDLAPTIEHHPTRIEDIVNETQGRFKGYYRIKLNILENGESTVRQPIGNVC